MPGSARRSRSPLAWPRLARFAAVAVQSGLIGLASVVLTSAWTALGPARYALLLFLVAYSIATTGLCLERAVGIRASFWLSFVAGLAFLAWSIGSYISFELGSEIYRDSPASLFVALLLGAAGLVCFAIPTVLTFAVLRNRGGGVHQGVPKSAA